MGGEWRSVQPGVAVKLDQVQIIGGKSWSRVSIQSIKLNLGSCPALVKELRYSSFSHKKLQNYNWPHLSSKVWSGSSFSIRIWIRTDNRYLLGWKIYFLPRFIWIFAKCSARMYPVFRWLILVRRCAWEESSTTCSGWYGRSRALDSQPVLRSCPILVLGPVFRIRIQGPSGSGFRIWIRIQGLTKR